MQHPAFLALTSSDRWCYQCMILEAKGKPDFEALVKAGFIDVTASGKSNRTKTDYRFSVRWKVPS